REHAFANAERGAGIAVATRNDDNPWRRFVPLPALRPCEQIAVGILSCNFEYRDFGKSARRRIAAPRVARDCALAFQIFENAFEGDAIGTFYAERAGEITLGALRFLCQRFENARLVERWSVAIRSPAWQALAAFRAGGRPFGFSRAVVLFLLAGCFRCGCGFFRRFPAWFLHCAVDAFCRFVGNQRNCLLE